ncbi:hypothetical protein KIN20_025238 [Parelaphostrongylus tenuis]|uniref:Ion transport domain-containing protein n=1 Tax=Parelaphostrongylus tenuis TaxID=148309 RepID=A0AAD5NBQ8_PARTN|nr:hypothetical protein KIN20_025238 [Parelaphostrongylus tenuis]
MLTRRKSSLPSDNKSDITQRKRRGESVIGLTEIINLEPSAISKKPSEILQNDVLKELVRVACLLSMISVCLHTPETIQLWPPLNYAIFANDCIVTLVFLVEAAIHIHHVGLWEDESSYLRARWSQFDLFMLLMHVMSCALHCYELFTILVPSLGFVVSTVLIPLIKNHIRRNPPEIPFSCGSLFAADFISTDFTLSSHHNS